MCNQSESFNRDILEVRTIYVEGFLARLEDMIKDDCIELNNGIDLALELTSNSITPKTIIDKIIYDWVDKMEESQEIINYNNYKFKKIT